MALLRAYVADVAVVVLDAVRPMQGGGTTAGVLPAGRARPRSAAVHAPAVTRRLLRCPAFPGGACVVDRRSGPATGAHPHRARVVVHTPGSGTALPGLATCWIDSSIPTARIGPGGRYHQAWADRACRRGSWSASQARSARNIAGMRRWLLDRAIQRAPGNGVCRPCSCS